MQCNAIMESAKQCMSSLNIVQWLWCDSSPSLRNEMMLQFYFVVQTFECGAHQCWTRVYVNAWYQCTITIVVLKDLPDQYQNHNTCQMLILGGCINVRESLCTWFINWVLGMKDGVLIRIVSKSTTFSYAYTHLYQHNKLGKHVSKEYAHIHIYRVHHGANALKYFYKGKEFTSYKRGNLVQVPP